MLCKRISIRLRGHYPDRDEEGVHKSYGDKYDRLVALKDQYDPTNLFRLNQNIPPSK